MANEVGHGFKDNKDIYTFPDDLVDQVKRAVFDQVYPVGSIFMTTDSKTPSQLGMPGGWVQWGSGKVPVGVSSSNPSYNAAEKTGGTDSGTVNITLSERNMPAHSHNGFAHSHKVPYLNYYGVSESYLTLINNGRAMMVHDPKNLGPEEQGKTSSNVNIFATKYWDTPTKETDTSTRVMSLGKAPGNLEQAMKDDSIVHTLDASGTLENAGGSQPFNVDVRQAYITCYMWKRISKN